MKKPYIPGSAKLKRDDVGHIAGCFCNCGDAGDKCDKSCGEFCAKNETLYEKGSARFDGQRQGCLCNCKKAPGKGGGAPAPGEKGDSPTAPAPGKKDDHAPPAAGKKDDAPPAAGKKDDHPPAPSGPPPAPPGPPGPPDKPGMSNPAVPPPGGFHCAVKLPPLDWGDRNWPHLYDSAFAVPEVQKMINGAQCRKILDENVWPLDATAACKSFVGTAKCKSCEGTGLRCLGGGARCVALRDMDWKNDPFLKPISHGGYGISQRFIGNCWAVAGVEQLLNLHNSMSTDKIDNFPITPCQGVAGEVPAKSCLKLSPSGKYKARLFNPVKEAWIEIDIPDDHVPAVRHAGGCKNNFGPALTTNLFFELLSLALIQAPKEMLGSPNKA